MSVEADRDWLAKNYPGLKYKTNGVIEGSLSFQMLHLDGQHYIRPDSEFVAKHYSRGIHLCDTYKVKIVPQRGRNWPFAHETGSRITTVANQRQKSAADLHLYVTNNAMCLASNMELDRTFDAGFNLPVFIDEFLVPFLFEQTYYAQNGLWLWGELAHGYKGLLQWLGREDGYSDADIIATHKELMSHNDTLDAKKALNERCRGHKPCLCESGKKMRDCCPDIKMAISRLRHAANRGIISLDSVTVRL